MIVSEVANRRLSAIQAALVARALPYLGDTHTVADIEAMVEAGDLQCWEGDETIVLARVAENPRKRELVVFLAAGNQEEIKRLHPIVIDWGRQMGCSRAVFAGRPGWSRSFLVREEDWRLDHFLYTREL